MRSPGQSKCCSHRKRLNLRWESPQFIQVYKHLVNFLRGFIAAGAKLNKDSGYFIIPTLEIPAEIGESVGNSEVYGYAVGWDTIKALKESGATGRITHRH